MTNIIVEDEALVVEPDSRRTETMAVVVQEHAISRNAHCSPRANVAFSCLATLTWLRSRLRYTFAGNR